MSHLLVGFNGYVYAAISAQLRRFDPNLASAHDLQTNELLNHNTSVFLPSSCRQQRSQSTTNAQRRRVADIFHHQLLNMLGLIVLNWGCVHCRLEHLSGTGEMHSGQFDFDNDAFDPCGTDCFICTGEWKKQFRAVHLDTAVRWLDSGAIRDAFPIVGKTDDIGDFCNQLIKSVWEQPKTIEALFDLKKSSITKGIVSSFLLQLIAANILSIDVVSRDIIINFIV